MAPCSRHRFSAFIFPTRHGATRGPATAPPPPPPHALTPSRRTRCRFPGLPLPGSPVVPPGEGTKLKRACARHAGGARSETWHRKSHHSAHMETWLYLSASPFLVFSSSAPPSSHGMPTAQTDRTQRLNGCPERCRLRAGRGEHQGVQRGQLDEHRHTPQPRRRQA